MTMAFYGGNDVRIPQLRMDVADLELEVYKLQKELKKSQTHISNLRDRVKMLEKQ